MEETARVVGRKFRRPKGVSRHLHHCEYGALSDQSTKCDVPQNETHTVLITIIRRIIERTAIGADEASMRLTQPITVCTLLFHSRAYYSCPCNLYISTNLPEGGTNGISY